MPRSHSSTAVVHDGSRPMLLLLLLLLSPSLLLHSTAQLPPPPLLPALSECATDLSLELAMRLVAVSALVRRQATQDPSCLSKP